MYAPIHALLVVNFHPLAHRLLRPPTVGNLNSEAEVATALASAVTGPNALGQLAKAALLSAHHADGLVATWHQQPPAAVIQRGIVTSGSSQPGSGGGAVYGRQAPSPGPADTASAAAGAAAAAAAAAAAPSSHGSRTATDTVHETDLYKTDLLLCLEDAMAYTSSRTVDDTNSGEGGDVLPQAARSAVSADGSDRQGHAASGGDQQQQQHQQQQQQQQRLEAATVPPLSPSLSPTPMPDLQGAAGGYQGTGGGSAVAVSSSHHTEEEMEVEAGPAAKRRRVQPQCVCVGELKVVAKLMEDGGRQPVDLYTAWRNSRHARHTLAVAVMSQVGQQCLGCRYGHAWALDGPLLTVWRRGLTNDRRFGAPTLAATTAFNQLDYLPCSGRPVWYRKPTFITAFLCTQRADSDILAGPGRLLRLHFVLARHVAGVLPAGGG